MDSILRRLPTPPMPVGNPFSHRQKTFLSKTLLHIGRILVVLGLLVIIAQIVQKILFNSSRCGTDYCLRSLLNIDTGFWCGSIITFFGVLSVICGRHPHLPAMATVLRVFNIITAMLATALVVISGVNIGFSFHPHVSDPNIRPYTRQYTPCSEPWQIQTRPSDWIDAPVTTPYRRYDFGWRFTTARNYYEEGESNDETGRRKKRYYYDDYDPNPAGGRRCFVRSIHWPWLTQLAMSCLMAFCGFFVFVLSIIEATLTMQPSCCPMDNDGDTSLAYLSGVEFPQQEQKDKFGANPDPLPPVDLLCSTTDDDVPLLAAETSSNILHV